MSAQPNIYQAMTDAELVAAVEALRADAAEIAARGLKLDMARGKPSPEQVALSRPLLDVLTSESDLTDDGADASNYGLPDGLPAARELMADLLGVDAANVVVGGSSSLEIMNDALHHGWIRGIQGNEPWGVQAQRGELKWLCPCPGYDRHFLATQYLGFTNVPVPMLPSGGFDIATIRELAESDPSVKGVWIVPKYQNPTGVTLSAVDVRALASLRPAAPDFRIFYDNAYLVHAFAEPDDELLEIFGACAEAGTTDLVYEFASTAKVTFPGAGIACVTASPADMADLRKSIAVQRVCANKLVQLAHVRWLRDVDGIKAHMARQAEVLGPRFEVVERGLSEGIGGLGIATWTHPRGGYFVSFDAPEGCAKAIVAKCAELGVVLTGAGATWPGGNDPRDTNIRIAPSYPAVDDLRQAIEVLCAATKLVAAEQELARR